MRFVWICFLFLIAASVSSCREDVPESLTPPAQPPVAVEYRAAVTLVPESPVARRVSTVSVRIEGPSDDLPQLEPIAGSDVHLVAVSRDLSWYDHAHPRRDGSTWVAVLVFPNAGEYVLHTIFRPTNAGQVVRKHVIHVGGAVPAAHPPLTVSPREKRSGHFTVHLRTEPEPPAVGVWSSLIFRIHRDSVPVTNLTPTGTLGHIVILRDGGEDFVYAHSTDGEARSGVRARAHVPAVPSSLDSDHSRHVGDTGPEVTFHTRFPASGKYRMWVEFLAGNDAIKADFVVDAGEPPPPPEHKD